MLLDHFLGCDVPYTFEFSTSEKLGKSFLRKIGEVQNTVWLAQATILNLPFYRRVPPLSNCWE